MTEAVFDSASLSAIAPDEQPKPIPLRELLLWVVFGGLLLIATHRQTALRHRSDPVTLTDR